MDLRPLQSAGFRHLAAAYWINEFGTWIGEIALTILVYNHTHSPIGTAALFVGMRSVPALAAPALTTRIEVMRVRPTLTTLYVLEALLYAGIAFITHHFSLAAVLVLAGLDGCLAIVAKALTRSATVTNLARMGLLREGNAILNLGVMAATACSPLIAGALVAWRGAELALLVDTGTFVVTAMIIATTRGLRIETDQLAGWRGRLRNGVDVLRTRPTVRRLMTVIALVFLLCAIPAPIDVVFVKHTLHGDDRGYGLLLASWGLGMVIGAAAFAAFSDVRLSKMIVLGTVLIAVGYGGTAASPTLLAACLASALGGIGNGAAWVAAVTAVQQRIPLHTQSAVNSVLETLNQIMPAIGFVTGGALAVAMSARFAYATAGIGVAFVAVLLALRPIDHVILRRVGATPEPADPTPSAAQEPSSPDRTHPMLSSTSG